jgi:hypothetical protein
VPNTNEDLQALVSAKDREITALKEELKLHIEKADHALTENESLKATLAAKNKAIDGYLVEAKEKLVTEIKGMDNSFEAGELEIPALVLIKDTYVKAKKVFTPAPLKKEKEITQLDHSGNELSQSKKKLSNIEVLLGVKD